MGLQTAALIGHSMGGGTAADFALVHPERTWALVLVGPGLQPVRFARSFVQEQHAEQAAAMEALNGERYVEAFLRYGVDGRRAPDEVDPALRRRMHDSALAAITAHRTAQGKMLSPNAAEHLSGITPPTR